MSRAPYVAAVLATAAAVALAGCSGAPTPAASSSSTPEKVTITYANFISNGGNEANLTKIVDAFQQANPDITVKVTTRPYTDYFTALQTDLAGGTVADVFDMEYAGYSALQSSGVLAPLDGVDASAYQKSLIDAYQTDGKQYALPTSFSTVVLYYNKALFDAAGVAYRQGHADRRPGRRHGGLRHQPVHRGQARHVAQRHLDVRQPGQGHRSVGHRRRAR